MESFNSSITLSSSCLSTGCINPPFANPPARSLGISVDKNSRALSSAKIKKSEIAT
jgi:hypothetical protein